MQVCKSFLRCIDVIEIFKIRLLFTGPAFSMVLEGGFNIGDVDYTGLNNPSSTRLQTINGDNILDSTHTHPTEGCRPGSTVYFYNIGHTGTNPIDDSRMTPDVLHQRYPTIGLQHLDRSIIVADDRYSLSNTHPTLQAVEGRQHLESGRCILDQVPGIWVNQHYHR